MEAKLRYLAENQQVNSEFQSIAWLYQEIKKDKEILEKFYKLIVGRDLKMIELKNKIKELEEKVKEKEEN